jgi:serine/threonine kinase 16
MKEVEAYKLFANSTGIIHSVDYSIATERGNDPSSKTVYVLLPYYRRGNLQDMINANLVNHTRFPEQRLMLLFLGVCKALKNMHQYTGGAGGERMEMHSNGVDTNAEAGKKAAKKTIVRRETGADEDHETEQQRPLMLDDESAPSGGGGPVRSYAHRDIKPGQPPPSHQSAQHSRLTLGAQVTS